MTLLLESDAQYQDGPEVGVYTTTGGRRADGLPCAVCGWRLEQTSIGEGDAGAIHTHVRCTICGAHGCLSLNMPGKKSACERGRALTGGR